MVVGDIFLAAFVTVLFERLASQELLKFARQALIDVQLEEWTETLEKIQAVLSDAEEKQITNRSVKKWLEHLQDLAYDLDDILDELATESSQCELMARWPQPQPRTSKWVPDIVSKLTSSIADFMSAHNMRSKIDEISARLQRISKRQNDLDLKEDVGGSRWKRECEKLPSTSLAERQVYGREEDKEAILKLLLRCEPASNNDEVPVIPIVGMGGIGKTTLAQLVYNDDKLKSCFDLKAWACVSDDFDIVRVTKSIIESLTLDSCNLNDLNALQLKLQGKLFGKKFLLVLDDVWSDNYQEWDVLCRPFLVVAPGSKIIITTRNRSVASMMTILPSHHLEKLGKQDSLSLFTQHALRSRNFDKLPNLKEIGEKIVEKCKGLPLAIKTLGALLCTDLRQKKWEDILNSKIWDLPEQKSGLLPALQLSYHHLPSHLKSCFAYCAIFPKDYEFDKDELILLWMAIGLLQQSKERKQMEEFGGEFFDELLSRSFFQQSSGNKSRFVMHDLINDLAEFVAGEICFRLDDKLETSKQDKFSKRARHSSYIRQSFEVFQGFKDFYKVQHLRTFLPLASDAYKCENLCYLSNKVLQDLLPKLQCLRVLSLKSYNMRELPNSIENLRHLRYLNLSETSIKWLPESVCTLYNLQTLLLRSCYDLCELPTSIGKLINLRHLDNDDTFKLGEMASGIGKLTSLQTLSKIVLAKGGGLKLRELGGLMLLRGMLSIERLQNVTDIQDAKEANLKDKQELDDLRLAWGISCDEKLEMDVLDMLQPHNNLKRLQIQSYMGVKFPSWIGGPSLSKVVGIHLSGCKKCTILPTLGQLPMLKDLYIGGMDEVRSVGDEFYGNGTNTLDFYFPSLQTLSFKDMQEWKEWSYFIGHQEVRGQFPQLLELTISKCPKLIKFPLLKLPSLRRLDLGYCCGVIVKTFADLTSLISLTIDGMTELTCLHDEFLQRMTALEDLVVSHCNELVTLWQNGVTLQNLVHLKDLNVHSCRQLVYLGEEEQGLPCNLEVLTLRDCDNLEKLPSGLSSLKSLRELRIKACPKLASLPETGIPPMLKRLDITDCRVLESLPNVGISHLKDLVIFECSSLITWPTGKVPTTLKLLSVSNCTHLEVDPDSITSLEYLFLSHWRNIRRLFGSMHNFASLVKLKIESCDDLECFPDTGLPTPNLTSLTIQNCVKLRSLPDQIQSLSSLKYMSISDCPNLDCFPKADFPPNLTSLLVVRCEKLKNLSEWGLHRLTSLREFSINGGYPDLFSFSKNDDESVLPATLTSLQIEALPSLESLSKGFQNLTSLQQLFICDCPKLQSLPKGDLLPMLSILVIGGCPLVEQRCAEDIGDYWPKIADIPCLTNNTLLPTLLFKLSSTTNF